MPSPETHQLLLAAAAAAEDKKAEDIRILSLDPSESSLTDYFLICNGSSDRQNSAITDEIEIRLKRDFGIYPTSVEGRRQGEWILMDYTDFIVHVFSAEKRAYYGLERLRKSATTLSIADLNIRTEAADRRHPQKESGTCKESSTRGKEKPQKSLLQRKRPRKSQQRSQSQRRRSPPRQPKTRALRVTTVQVARFPRRVRSTRREGALVVAVTSAAARSRGSEASACSANPPAPPPGPQAADASAGSPTETRDLLRTHSAPLPQSDNEPGRVRETAAD